MFELETYLNDFLGIVKRSVPISVEWVKVRDEMVVHTRGVYPVELIEKFRPNEPEDVKDYRMVNYRAITVAPINEGIDSLYRVLLQSNYKIELPDDIRDYVLFHKFKPIDYPGSGERFTFMEYLWRVLFRTMIDDPNGAVVWLPVNPVNPYELPSETPENMQVDVAPTYVGSGQIIDSNSDVFSFRALEDWKLYTSDGERYEPYYFIVTNDVIMRHVPTRVKDGEVLYESELYYTLNPNDSEEFPDKPVVILGGDIAKTAAGVNYYVSYFNGFVAPANEAISAFSDDQGVRVRMNFPIIEEKGSKCPECRGAGVVYGKDNDSNSKRTCGVCKGRKTIVSKSPYSTYVIPEPSDRDNPEWVRRPAVTFLSPDTAILERSNKTWREFIRDAKNAVHTLFIDEAQSGVAKNIDREKKYDSLLKISKNVFGNIIDKSLHFIQAYREPIPDRRGDIIIIEPSSFQILSTSDILEELTNMKSKGVPPIFVIKAAMSLSEKLYSNDAAGAKVIKLLAMWDTLFPYNPDDISKLKATGSVTVEQIAKHINSNPIVMRLATEDGFMEEDMATLMERADILLEPLLPKTTAAPVINAIADALS